MKWLKGLSMLLGRLLIAPTFIIAGVGKFLSYEETMGYMASKGMTLIPFFLISAALIEILGALSLILGYKTRWGALLLIVMLIPTTLIFHDFWNLSGPEYLTQRGAFLSNLAILGGLFTLVGCGGGMIALDNCCGKKHHH